MFFSQNRFFNLNWPVRVHHHVVGRHVSHVVIAEILHMHMVYKQERSIHIIRVVNIRYNIFLTLS